MSRNKWIILGGLAMALLIVCVCLSIVLLWPSDRLLGSEAHLAVRIGTAPPNTIAFAAGPWESQDIYVVNRDASVARVTNGMMVDGLACSPDGRAIAFWERGERKDIQVVNVDGSGLTNLTQGVGDSGLVSWSPDSTRLAFESEREGNDDVYAVNSDGTGLTRLTAHPAKDVFPMWSPQGESIAFSSEQDGNREIYTINSDGSGLTNLTKNPATDDIPVWSPDGSRIAFLSNRAGPAFNLFIMHADGTDVKQITSAKLFGDLTLNHSWSPDGRLVAFQQNLYPYDTESDIWVAAADGSQTTPALCRPGRQVGPSWAPDGSWIAFVADQDGEDQLYLTIADGSEVMQITYGSLEVGDYSWCGTTP